MDYLVLFRVGIRIMDYNGGIRTLALELILTCKVLIHHQKVNLSALLHIIELFHQLSEHLIRVRPFKNIYKII